MIVFALLCLIILIFWYHVNSIPHNRYRNQIENNYTNFIVFILIVLAAFRSDTTGADTPGYIKEYSEVLKLSWSEIAEQFRGYSMYYYISKIFSIFHMPLFVWFGFVEFLYLYAVKLFIKRHSYDPILSFLVFLSIGLFAFSLAGLKQVMAMAFMLYSYLFFIQKQHLRALILFLLAYLSHPTSLFSVVLFVLYVIRDRKIFWPIVLLIAITLSFYGGPLLVGATEYYEQGTGNSHFNSYLVYDNRYSPVMLVYYLSLILFSLPGLSNYKKVDKSQMRLTLAMCIISSSAQVLAFFTPHAFRIAYYFLPFYLILVPNSYHMMSGSVKKMMCLVILVSLIFYFLYVNRNFVYSMNF